MNVSMTADTDDVIPDASSEQLGSRRGGLLAGASVPLLLLKVVVENFVVVVTTALFCAYLSGFCATR